MQRNMHDLYIVRICNGTIRFHTTTTTTTTSGSSSRQNAIRGLGDDNCWMYGQTIMTNCKRTCLGKEGQVNENGKNLRNMALHKHFSLHLR